VAPPLPEYALYSVWASGGMCVHEWGGWSAGTPTGEERSKATMYYDVQTKDKIAGPEYAPTDHNSIASAQASEQHFAVSCGAERDAYRSCLLLCLKTYA
jgi:hypothetical protein